MDLRHERTGGIQDAQPARLRILLHELGDAMRTENSDRSRRHFREVLDETCAFCAQGFDDVPVVNDFVPDVDRRAKLRERLLDDVDGPDHAGAETAWLGEHYPHGSDLAPASNKATDCIIE